MSKTKAELRVEIAKDVLAALKSNRMMASYMGYLSHNDLDERQVAREVQNAYWNGDNKALAQFAKQEYVAPKECYVCAIGAVFVATVDRHDSFDLRRAYAGTGLRPATMLDYLKEWFSVKQLRLMEVAYEFGAHGEPDDGPSREAYDRAIAFHCRTRVMGKPGEQGETIMTAIMDNIIKNKGSFRP